MRRRDFVRRLPVVASGVLLGAGAVSLAGCAGAAYVLPRAAPGRLVIGRSELGEEGHAFLQGPGMERPVYVRVLASCTHQGCQPEPVGDRLVCPCHGSEFAFDGSVLEGPAERPLTRYAVSVEGEDIVVRLDGGTT
jgi:cytochrome b6-f complex iron-sulfur subunit